MIFRLTLYFILLCTAITPLLLNHSVVKSNKTDFQELYLPAYSKINSVKDAINFIDDKYHKTHKNFDTATYVNEVTAFTKRRFFHGLSTYNIHENWIAYLCGKLLWSHMSAIVAPDDILKHSEGLCSQQSIVFMEILISKGISCRAVGLGFKEGPGHFLSEVRYGGSWHLHDVTVEPQWHKVVNHHKSLEYYKQNIDSLYLAYNGRLDRKIFDKIMAKVEYGKVNEFPAKNMLIFHSLTLLITYFLPLLFLFLISFLKYSKIKHSNK